MSETRNFWSRRKAAVLAETEAEREALKAAVAADEQAALEAKTDDEILAEFNLPNPDDLQPGDDVSGFMTQAIPDRLRRRALRRLWRLNPVLANVDGLVDYGEDYTDAACVIENLQTAYQVGKGMLAHIEALAADDPEDEDTPNEAIEDEAPDLIPELKAPPAPVATYSPQIDAPEDVMASPAPRRMKFEFER